MEPRVSLSELPDDEAEALLRDAAATVIYVCTTCRRPGDAPEAPRPGAAFAEATIAAAANTGVDVRPMRCLGNCKRGCTALLRSAGTWSYVFGDLDPAT